MGPILKNGILLGVLVVVWTFVMGFTGWYKHPTLNLLFFLVILIEVWVLLSGLRETAPTGSYGQQVMTGTLIAALGAIIIFVGSYVFTTVAFPTYFTDIEQVQREMLQAQGLAPAEIEAQVKAAEAMQTPFMNAATGAVATIITGLIASLLIAVRVRKR